MRATTADASRSGLKPRAVASPTTSMATIQMPSATTPRLLASRFPRMSDSTASCSSRNLCGLVVRGVVPVGLLAGDPPRRRLVPVTLDFLIIELMIRLYPSSIYTKRIPVPPPIIAAMTAMIVNTPSSHSTVVVSP